MEFGRFLGSSGFFGETQGNLGWDSRGVSKEVCGFDGDLGRFLGFFVGMWQEATNHWSISPSSNLIRTSSPGLGPYCQVTPGWQVPDIQGPLVLRGFLDRQKDDLQTDSPTSTHKRFPI